MAYDLAKVTTNGNNLIAQILANKSSLSIDKIEISDTQLPSTTDISTMTSVPKVVQTVSANGFSKNSNTLIVSTVVDNSSIRADYKAWVFGIWGSDSQNGQSQLIAVITSTNSPDTIPAFSGRTPVSYTYKFNIGFSNASQIKFNMINGSFATNDTVVHTTGNETINGKKKFDTDPTDGAGNAYAKTVDVNQQLDKKVNTADMRKPASDVAGIEEVSTGLYKGSLKIYTDLDTLTQEGIYDFVGIILVNFIDSNYHWGTIQIINKSDVVFQYVVSTSKAGNQIYFRMQSGSHATWLPWRMVSAFSMDNQLTLPNGELITPADDSKVAHLSGANNFDTVPTVNNNPLLLASSLPSDLARTGQDQEFTGKNTFDTAPIDKTTGHPYITKDGVPSIPSDVARTGQAQTFTAAQTFSIAPTIKDASTDKGDNQAATMADLKSVENSAWRQLDCSSYTAPLYKGIILYKIDEANKQIYFKTISQSVFTVNGEQIVKANSSIVDFSAVVNKILSVNCLVVSAEYSSGSGSNYAYSSVLNASGSVLINKSQFLGYPYCIFAVLPNTGNSIPYITYDSLVNN